MKKNTLIIGILGTLFLMQVGFLVGYFYTNTPVQAEVLSNPYATDYTPKMVFENYRTNVQLLVDVASYTLKSHYDCHERNSKRTFGRLSLTDIDVTPAIPCDDDEATKLNANLTNSLYFLCKGESTDKSLLGQIHQGNSKACELKKSVEQALDFYSDTSDKLSNATTQNALDKSKRLEKTPEELLARALDSEYKALTAYIKNSEQRVIEACDASTNTQQKSTSTDGMYVDPYALTFMSFISRRDSCKQDIYYNLELEGKTNESIIWAFQQFAQSYPQHLQFLRIKKQFSSMAFDLKDMGKALNVISTKIPGIIDPGAK